MTGRGRPTREVVSRWYSNRSPGRRSSGEGFSPELASFPPMPHSPDVREDKGCAEGPRRLLPVHCFEATERGCGFIRRLRVRATWPSVLRRAKAQSQT